MQENNSPHDGQVSREAAQAQIKEIAGDPAHPFWDIKHAGHQEAVAEMERLNRVVYAGSVRQQPEPKQGDRTGYSADLTKPELPADLPPAPAGQEYDPSMIREIQGAAADLGVAPDDAQEFLRYLVGFKQPADDKAFKAALASAERTLKAEWKDQFDAKLEAARHVYQRLPGALQVAIDESGLGNDPYVIRKFAALGEPMIAAKAEIERIMGDRNHPYWHRRHPLHEKAMAEMRRLHEKAHGTRPLFEPIR